MSKPNIFLKIRETRDAKIAQSKRAKDVSKMFWDESQRQLYPNANMITLPVTNETLNSQEDLEDEDIIAQFISNLRSISNGKESLVRDIGAYIDTEFSKSAMEYLNTNWSNIKTELAKTKKAYTSQMLKTFLKNYLKNNADEQEINQANPVQSELVAQLDAFNAEIARLNEAAQTAKTAAERQAANRQIAIIQAQQAEVQRLAAEAAAAAAAEAAAAAAAEAARLEEERRRQEAAAEAAAAAAQAELDANVAAFQDLPNVITPPASPKNKPLIGPLKPFMPGDYDENERKKTEYLTKGNYNNGKEWTEGIYEFFKTIVPQLDQSDQEELTEKFNEILKEQPNKKIFSIKGLKDISAFINTKAPEVGRISGNGLKSKKKSKKSRHKTFGSGIASHNIDPKFYVDMKYMNKDQLAVKYKSTQTWVMRPTKLSEPTKKVVMDILLDKLNQKAYDKLNENEKDVIRKFCDLARIKVCESYNKEIQNLQLKAEVLIGEIKSGNDSKVVRKMLIDAIEMLMKHNGISKIEGLELLNQLKE